MDQRDFNRSQNDHETHNNNKEACITTHQVNEGKTMDADLCEQIDPRWQKYG